jgi:hypothetical protein
MLSLASNVACPLVRIPHSASSMPFLSLESIHAKIKKKDHKKIPCTGYTQD